LFRFTSGNGTVDRFRSPGKNFSRLSRGGRPCETGGVGVRLQDTLTGQRIDVIAMLELCSTVNWSCSGLVSFGFTATSPGRFRVPVTATYQQHLQVIARERKQYGQTDSSNS